jgi:hypothetical protein
MSSLYYMSLLGVGDWNSALRQSGAQLAPYYAYLTTALSAAEDRALCLSWRDPTSAERELLSRASGVWVMLEPRPDHAEEPDSTFEAFFDAKSIFDQPPTRRGHKVIWPPKEQSIAILGYDREAQALLLADLPEPIVDADAPDQPSTLLYLRPNTWPLECQRRAIETLEQRPTPRLSPLMRLISTAPTWPQVSPVAHGEGDWAILRRDAHGRLRDGTEEQRRFVAMALATPDFAVLEGPPGSGKTTAICELIVQLARAQKRVLLVASTHVAVDNVLERLLAWQDQSEEKLVMPVRIGDEDKVSSPIIAEWVLRNLARTWSGEIQQFLENPRGATPEGAPARDMLTQALKHDGPPLLTELILDASNLVCGTTIGILQHPAIKARDTVFQPFDVLILDEASKTTFTEFLVPALYARRWVIVGDRRQLSPYVETQDLVENLAGLLPAELAQAAVHTFLVSSTLPPGQRVGALVAVESDEQVRCFTEEAAARAVEFVNLDAVRPQRLYGVDGACPELLTTQLVLGKSSTISAWQHRLPGDLQAVSGPVPELPAWQAHRRALETSEIDEPASWANEVAWRQIRAFELRQAPAEQARLLEQLEQLRPRTLDERFFTARRSKPRFINGVPQTADEALDEALDNMRRAAMPSILEILQTGAGVLGRHRETPLSVGLGNALAVRMASLRFQHRMHPDISRFPREQFYAQAGLLNDAADMHRLRQWSYAQYARRAVWLDIRRRRGEHGNENVAEADALLEELYKFVVWARDQPHPSGNPEAVWEVAVLTFYRAQERLLRDSLREVSKQFGSSRNFHLPRATQRIHVTLCTVDRFQGYEADLVLLSFVKSGSVGFLNSPNRMNVALTRARYQLVLIGDRSWLASERCRSELLRGVSQSPHYARDIGWEAPR